MEILHQPLPWYIVGPLIGLIIPMLLISGNKHLGVSSSLRHLCAACLPVKIKFFDYNWKNEGWSLVLVLGIVVGGAIGNILLSNPEPVNITPEEHDRLHALGISDFSKLIPTELFNWHSLLTLKGFILIVIGGFFVGFGTRYANGCTSGHSIMGMSLLSWASLVATISFFAGGLVATHFLLPHILTLP